MSEENKYPPPKKEKEFKLAWNAFIDSVTRRDNFHKGHLLQLEILCDLYSEKKKLMDIIEEEGATYATVGRHGLQRKVAPEVDQLNKVRGHIKLYSRSLGLDLMKDPGANPEANKEDDWK